MNDLTKMSDEELIVKARNAPYARHDIMAQLASRLTAALEREREDVEALKAADAEPTWHSAWNLVKARLAAREKKLHHDQDRRGN